MTPGAWMESEILSQPTVLASNCERYFRELEAALALRSFDMVLLVARGSSDNAALYARYLIEIHLGVPVSLAAPSVITRFGATVRYPKCLAVGISQSGAAPDVSEVLAELKRQGHFTLAITNTPQSLITEVAASSLLLECGDERSVAATKTYTASLLALYQMVRALGGNLPDPVSTLPDQDWLDVSRSAAQASLGAVLRSARWFSLGRGYSFCTAEETALKLMECALIPCKSYSTADFQHGPKALATHGSVALVYGTDELDISENGCLIERAPSAGATPLAPLSEVVYGQFLALHAARARGLDPDHPDHLLKVTETL